MRETNAVVEHTGSHTSVNITICSLEWNSLTLGQ